MFTFHSLIIVVMIYFQPNQTQEFVIGNGSKTCGDRIEDELGKYLDWAVDDINPPWVWEDEWRQWKIVLNTVENVTFDSCISATMGKFIELRMWLYDSNNTNLIAENDNSELARYCYYSSVIKVTNLAPGDYNLWITSDNGTSPTLGTSEFLVDIVCGDVIIATQNNVVIDIDTDGDDANYDISSVGDLVDSMFFDLLFFMIGYAVILVIFLIAMFCKRVDDTRLRFKLVLFSITLILEVFDVVSDIALVDGMYSGGHCGITACQRQSNAYANAMIPFIILGGIISLFGNGLFLYLSISGTDDDTMWKIESYAELCKVWLEDIPVIIILFIFNKEFYLDPNNPDAAVPWNPVDIFFVSVYISLIDVIYAFVSLCGDSLFGKHFTNQKEKSGFIYCNICTLIVFIVLMSLTLMTAYANWSVYSMNGECYGTEDVVYVFENDPDTGAQWSGEIFDWQNSSYGYDTGNQYAAAFIIPGEEVTADMELTVILDYISTPFKQLIYYPDNCTYTTTPRVGQCGLWYAQCMNYCGGIYDHKNGIGGVGDCIPLQPYYFNGTIPNMCTDYCT